MSVASSALPRGCRAGSTARRSQVACAIRAFTLVGTAALLGISTAFAQSVYRLDRVSVDGAGGGVAEGVTYSLLVSIGQHDADAASSSATYRYAGGVFAQIPDDMLFRDGFEGE